MSNDMFNAPNRATESAFEGMDEAVKEGGEKLPPHSKTRVKITNFLVESGAKYGTSAIFEFDVVQSSDPGLAAGTRAGLAFHKITEKDGNGRPTKGATFKQAMIKEFVAALFKVDPKTPQKWGEITTGLAKNPTPIIGRELVVEMGAQKTNENGPYVEKKGFYPV